jgi:hypothetical protein
MIYPNRTSLNCSTIHSCFINQRTRSAHDGSPWSSGVKPSPKDTGLWRPTLHCSPTVNATANHDPHSRVGEMIRRLRAMREPGESYSDVFLRIAGIFAADLIGESKRAGLRATE